MLLSALVQQRCLVMLGETPSLLHECIWCVFFLLERFVLSLFQNVGPAKQCPNLSATVML